jgi:hypothetical protein
MENLSKESIAAELKSKEKEALEELKFFMSLDDGAMWPWGTCERATTYCFRGSEEKLKKFSFPQSSEFLWVSYTSTHTCAAIIYRKCEFLERPIILCYVEPEEYVKGCLCGDY